MSELAELKELMLREPRWTLAVAESLTCGLLQARLGEQSGASQFFLGGITTYSLAQKVRHLGVDETVAAPVNSVSELVARQMARGARALFGSDFALATTGYAEPPAADVAPYAWWSVSDGRANEGPLELSGCITCPEQTRQQVRESVVEAALLALLMHLRERRGRDVSA
ncbi:MAG TPA: CinA family protein [Candidatus Synoicihabitans sp.]|nr:CinA family protein [Candidatus Synoicihabitans sp.]